MIKSIESIAQLPDNYEVIEAKVFNENFLYKNKIITISFKKNIKGEIKSFYNIIAETSEEREKIVYAVKKIREEIKNSNRENEKFIEKEQITFFKTKNKNFIKEVYDQWNSTKESKENDINEDENTIKEISKLFISANELGASDIHIEVRKNFTSIRLRINGDLQFFDKKSNLIGKSMISSMYNALASTSSGITLDETKPQDALIDKVFNNKRLRFRMATVPAAPEGFDGILRLLDIPEDDTSFLDLLDLGYEDTEIQKTEEARMLPKGVIIMAGTTGSGKSTTLSNMIKKDIFENEGKIKVLTIEDPPEYFIRGATQIGVKRDKNGDATESFLSSIRGAMRSDPDIIMIGEVRDEQTANMCVSAAQTGHRVLTTLHASSALSIINRLENMGVKREVLSSPDFIAALMYQKLLKKNCPHCSIPLKNNSIPSKYSIERILNENFEISIGEINKLKKYIKENKNMTLLTALLDFEIKKLSEVEEIKNFIIEKNKSVDYKGLEKRISSVIDIETNNVRFRNEDGCKKCDYTGILGRTVVAEVIRPDSNMLELIANNKDRELETYWKKNLNGKDVFKIGIDKVKKGLIDPWEYESKLTLFGLK